MASKASAQLGYSGLCCIKCGEPGGVRLLLEDLETLFCPECNTEYTIGEVRDTLAQWQQVLAWVDAAPPRRAAEGTLKLPNERV
jgi:hypothetical protein